MERWFIKIGFITPKGETGSITSTHYNPDYHNAYPDIMEYVRTTIRNMEKENSKFLSLSIRKVDQWTVG